MASKKIMVDIMVVDKNATRAINKTAKAVDNLSDSQQLLNTRTKDGKATSGLNNAILLETSRLASDASYGLQGMANNIGQIASLFQVSAENSGGFINALRDVGRSILGVGGIMIGLQLLISFLPKLQKRFKESAAAADPLSDAFSNMKDKVDDTSGRFETYIAILESSTSSDSQKEKAIQALNKEFPEYIQNLDDASVTLDDVKNLTDDAAKANDDYRDSLVKLAMSQAALNKITELQAEIIDKEAPRRQELLKLGLTEESLMKQKAISVGEFTTVEQLARDKSVRRLQSEKEEHEEFIKNKREQIKALSEFYIFEDPDNSANKDRRNRIRAYDDETTRTTHEQLLERQKMMQVAFENFFGIQVVSNEKMLKENIDSADEIFKIFSHRFKQNQKNLREQLRQIINTFKKNTREQSTAVNNMFKSLGGATRELSILQKSFHDAEIARIRERKNIILNNDKLTSSQKESQLKKIEKQERAAEIRKIKSERDFFTLQQTLLIAQEVMRVKFHVMEQVRLAQLNAANAKSALTEVAVEGAAQASKASMSLGTFVSQLGPLGVVTFAASIGGILASILAARKKAQAQIASLTNVSVPSSGGGGASGVQAPDFNVVGASPESQLATAVGGAINRETSVVLRTTELDEVNNGVETDIQTSSF
tara:strand:+ start:2158 stop:4122 length:1965 start_codon:yes stop_codon:yes gene_type:complete